MGFQVIQIVAGLTTYSGISMTAELRASLAMVGVDCSTLNRIRWPMGAANHAHGEVLIDETTLRAILADNSNTLPGTCSVKLGEKDSEITLVGMKMLNPRPLTVAGTGGYPGVATSGQVRLYALPVVDGRYWRNDRAIKSYNVAGPAGSGIYNSTSKDPASGTLYTYDEILTDLYSDAGFTVTVTDAYDGTSRPYDVASSAHMAARIIDNLLAETGRVFVAKIDGTYAVQFVNNTNVVAVLTSVSGRIISGTASWAVTAGSGWLDQTFPSIKWQTNIIPPTVVVQFPYYLPAETTATKVRQNRTMYEVTAAYTASSASLNSNASNSPQYLSDPTPARGLLTVSNTAELATRSSDLAKSFYRRFLTGEMRNVVLSGIVSPTLGGACTVVEWVLDENGAYTIINAHADNPLLGMVTGAPSVMASGDALATANTSGTVVVRTQQRLCLGTVTAVTGASPDVPSNIAYTGTIDGQFAPNVFSAKTPIQRLIGPGYPGKIVAGTVGSKVVLNITDNPAGQNPTVDLLIALGESLATESCGSSPSPPRDTDFDIWNIVTDRTGFTAMDRESFPVGNREYVYGQPVPVQWQRDAEQQCDRTGVTILYRVIDSPVLQTMVNMAIDRGGLTACNRIGQLQCGRLAGEEP